MYFYQKINLEYKSKLDINGNAITTPTTEMKIKGYTATCVYSCVVIIFGTAYKKLSLY